MGRVKQPVTLKKQLFKHQLSSIYNMENLEREKIVYENKNIIETKMGINGDIPGSGKTLSMIGMIIRDKMEWNKNSLYLYEKVNIKSGGVITIRKFESYKRLPTTLVLVPSSIVNQWIESLKLSELKFTVIDTKKQVDYINVQDYDVIITTSNTFNILVMSYSDHAWKRIIIDEPSNTKIHNMKEPKFGFLWFITSHPNSISISHKNGFLKNIFENNSEKIEDSFKSIILRSSLDLVNESFGIPQTEYREYNFSKIFNGNFSKKNITTMLYEKDISDVLSYIGCTPCHSDLLNNEYVDKLQNIEGYECSICSDQISTPLLEKNCSNLFCGKCFVKWFLENQSCPLCRCKVITKNLIYINDTVDSICNQNPTNKVLDIIKLNKDGKFIIFYSDKSQESLICKKLTDESISFAYIKGTRKSREDSIKCFKEGKINVILLSLEFDGSGVDLKEATDVILYDKIGKDMKSKIIGRAERIGRECCLVVHTIKLNFKKQKITE